MKPELKKYAPYGLYIALLAAIFTGMWYFLFREFDLTVQIGLMVTVLALGAFVALDPDRIRIALTGRSARYTGETLLVGLALLAVLAIINFYAHEYPQEWDVTESQIFSLTNESITAMERLPEDVEITLFTTQIGAAENARKLLDQYVDNSNGKVSYQVVNPKEQPILAEQVGVNADIAVTLYLEMGSETETIDTWVTEQEVTGALVRLMSESRAVYFTTGHGETIVDQGGVDYFLSTIDALDKKGYELLTLNLLAEGEIPADAAVVVIAGPLSPISASEIALIAEYVDSGGRLIVMLEPSMLTITDPNDDLLVEYLQDTWGLVIGNDLVIDAQTAQLSYAISAAYPEKHPITQEIDGFNTVYPTARSVQKGEDITGMLKGVLVETAPFEVTWAETDLESLMNDGSYQPDEDEDLLGPIPLAVAAQNSLNDSRIVVFGDSEFVMDDYVAQFVANMDMFINAVDWAAGQEDLISLTPRNNIERFVVPPFPLYGALVALVSIILIPGIFVVAGVIVYLNRRRRV